MLKVGMLTSGGDCQTLNAAMRGVAKTLYNLRPDTMIYGFLDGYKGLMYGDSTLMDPSDFSGILTVGGTILGSSRQPFKKMSEPMEDGSDKVTRMIENYHALNLDCLVILGGNGTHKTANLLSQKGLNIVSLPKTIDNDIYMTDMTFGFHSALGVAANAIDCVHTTAASHDRVFIVELMGHKVGWLTLYAGIAGGSDIILIPEIPYRLDSVLQAIVRRVKSGKRFSIIAMAEGAVPEEFADLSNKEYTKRLRAAGYPSASYMLGNQIEEAIGQEVRIVVPGHTQRGGSPVPYDRVIATRLGAYAGRMIINGQFGYMAALDNQKIVKIPLSKVAGKLKKVDPKSDIIRQTRDIGISLGDEEVTEEI